MSGDSGWNAVIHHPSDLQLQNWDWGENDGEHDRELPSTVDMDAIKGGGSWDPASGQNGINSDNSDDESDSDDESSGGSEGSCSYSDSNSESEDDSSGEEDSESNSDCTSEHSEQTFSIRETNFEQGALKLKIAMKTPARKEEVDKLKNDRNKKVVVSKRTKTPIRINKISECSGDDSDSNSRSGQMSSQQSQISQQQPLQEINQEDLAAILPDQEHEDAPFDGFEDSESGRLVSKAIERMSLGADSDTSETADQNPVPYSSSLLQQFVEKTALLSEPRKKRNKLVKKLNEPEYACASNVSPDSGIQSVNNSPLHLNASPTSPTTNNQSPIQAAPPKPVVNVDRVLYPPKRKPGRPAKTTQVSTQPRGPGRPKMKPEIVAKIEKIEATKKAKDADRPKENQRKAVTALAQKKSEPIVEKDSDEKLMKNGKNKKAVQKRVLETAKPLKKVEETTEKSTRRKCLSKLVSSKSKDKVVPAKYDERVYKTRPERLAASKKDVDKIASQKISSEGKNFVGESKSLANNKRVPKENRGETAVTCKKKDVVKKAAVPVSRRVLKENKSNKKTSTNVEITHTSVQSVTSLALTDSMKSEQSDNGKVDKLSGVCHNHHHHKHHHKHRRRLIEPPKTPVRVDPSIVQELDKLIEEFSKCCSLGKNGTISTTAELPQIFRVKKLTKKRKGSSETSVGEDQKLKRRPKKDKAPSNTDSTSNTSTNSASTPNEQRLPLKKRHYHVSSPHSSLSSHGSGSETNQGNESKSKDNHIEEAIEATVRYGSESAKDKQSTIHKDNVPVTPKKRHRDTEASVSEKSNETNEMTVEKTSNVIEQPRRKKKIVKDLRVTVTKLIPEPGMLEKFEKVEKANSTEKNTKTTVEKKMEKVISEKLLKTADKVDTTAVERATKKDGEGKKSDVEMSKVTTNNEKAKVSDVVEPKSTVDNTTEVVVKKKKARRRKAINRTGFPSMKKKKKKVIPVAKIEDIDGPTPEKLAKVIVSKVPVAKTVETGKVEKSTKVPESIKKLEPNKATNETTVCGQLRVRKDLVNNVASKPTITSNENVEKVTEKSKIFDENESLEESLARYNQSLKIAELSEENLKKLDKSNTKNSTENNNNLRRTRKSSSPCPAVVKSAKRPKTDETENDAIQNSDVTSEDPLDSMKSSISMRGRRKQTKLKKGGKEETKEKKSVEKTVLEGAVKGKVTDEKSGEVIQSKSKISEKKIKEGDSKKTENEKKIEAKKECEKKVVEHRKADPEKRVIENKKIEGDKKAVEHEKKNVEVKKVDGDKKTVEGKRAESEKKLVEKKAENENKAEGKIVDDKSSDNNKEEQKKTNNEVSKNNKASYDNWWVASQGKNSNRNSVPSWNYKKIRCNVYFDVKPTTLYEPQACECKSESACGDECINRMCFSECAPQLCPSGEKCKNQKIQKHEWSPGLQRFMTENKGWGVKTNQPIKNGTFILEYVGEVVSEREFKSRMATRYADDTHHYCLHLDGGLVIDGHRMGGDGRFVNHSCEPNCDMQKWSVNGLPRMALFASRDIQAGEELTYDYNFALFNPSEGQQCKCGSSACRGVIGGKSQRVSRSVPMTPSRIDQDKKILGRPRKNARKSNTVMNATCKGICTSRKITDTKATTIKPLSNQQRSFVQQHQCFLVRNLDKLRRMKVTMKEKNGIESKITSDVFLSQLTALSNGSSRTVRTRRLAQAQDDPEVNKAAKLAKVLKEIYTVVTTAKDENNQLLCSSFINLPSKRKLPRYYEKIQDPIDLVTIEQCIGNGQYKTAEQFDQDMIRLFDNNVRFFGRTSEIGIAAARLRKLYLGSKANFVFAITEATGLAPSQSFLPSRGSTAGEEDVIRCICGLHRDEGLMIQCERCLVWQHCDCVKADTSVESYLCERCLPRPVELEIPIEGEDEDDKKHYVTLMRGDLQLRQGDTVYVLRDTPEKHTYKTIQKLDYEQMDIFRIERLWKNSKGERFVYGHNYLRPHETYHEPTRKFYENEIVCAPLYEAVPCDLVAERCWVLDPHTYCKGRPVGSKPEHTYVCEYRVDRAARLFSKVARARHAVCTKPYAFEMFPEKIKHYRTYLPHSLEGIALTKAAKEKKKTGQEVETIITKVEPREVAKMSTKNNKESWHKSSTGKGLKRRLSETVPVTVTTPFISLTQREEQRKRLNCILMNLLDRMPNKKDPLNVSFLLERNRRNRKRPGGLNP